MLEIGSVYKWEYAHYNFCKIPYNSGMYFMKRGTILTVLNCYKVPDDRSSASREWVFKCLIGEQILTLCGGREDFIGFRKIC